MTTRISIGPITVNIRARESWQSMEAFEADTPDGSIALDGIVRGGPAFNEETGHVNFDHHEGVVREATMSTAMQVYLAIKGGLMPRSEVYINDTDQDTSLAVWLLSKYKLFEGTASSPIMNRLLQLTNWLDITGGAFPMNLEDELLAQHNWVFEPYTILRTSGALASASSEVLASNLEAICGRLTKLLMGQAGRTPLDTRHEILQENPNFWVVDEVGGNHARYWLYGHGMRAFLSIVARRPDGRTVYSIGRRSRYVKFPLQLIYPWLNDAETSGGRWGGSDIIGGSPRVEGSGLAWQDVSTIIKRVLDGG